VKGKTVKVLSGEYAGAVGEVDEYRESGHSRVALSGIINGEEINGVLWFGDSALEVINPWQK